MKCREYAQNEGIARSNRDRTLSPPSGAIRVFNRRARSSTPAPGATLPTSGPSPSLRPSISPSLHLAITVDTTTKCAARLLARLHGGPVPLGRRPKIPRNSSPLPRAFSWKSSGPASGGSAESGARRRRPSRHPRDLRSRHAPLFTSVSPNCFPTRRNWRVI